MPAPWQMIVPQNQSLSYSVLHPAPPSLALVQMRYLLPTFVVLRSVFGVCLFSASVCCW